MLLSVSTVDMKTYPFSLFFAKVFLRYIRRIKVVRPLNYRPYCKADAIQLQKRNYGWKPYLKHFESRFTKFYESYWLPDALVLTHAVFSFLA